jgi:hypothetical protein
MRIITVRQPWAWAIIFGGKNIENRSMNIAGSYRGPIAIHAGQKNLRETWSLFLGTAPKATELQDKAAAEAVFGSIIGVVDLVDVHQCLGNEKECSSEEGIFPCSPWGLRSAKYHLVLANPRAIEPIRYKGFLGLRTISESEVLKEIHDQLTA